MTEKFSDCRVKTGSAHISKFILLMDEIVRCERHIADIYNAPSVDYYTAIREALLTIPVYFSTDSTRCINISLMMSSLTILPIGKTSSGRIVKPLLLASKLNVDNVVSQIWEKPIEKVGNLQFSRLLLIAEVFNNLPRLV
jgi:hypothetical protein